MSSETPSLTTVTADDVGLAEKELGATNRPLSLSDLTQKLAFAKTAGQRAKAVKTYDQGCRYEVGDFIYKEYDEPLTVGSKAVEHFTGAVILQVVAKTYYKHFDSEMLEVDYPGGGVFRKYVDYMKKTHTQVLLPSNVGGQNKTCDIMPSEEDPRLTELPMTERDLKTLERRLKSALAKDPKVFNWGDHWHLAAKRVDIPEDRIKEIEAGFAETRQSASTEDLVHRFFGLEPSNDMFELTCLSLDALLDKKYKREFLLLNPAGWGKWHLKKILNAMPDKLPLSAPMARRPELEETERPEMSIVQAFPIKVYLTWREILSGGLKVPRSLGRELSHSREYTLTDTEDGKAYTVYYFPASNFFLGLSDFYGQGNVPQGTSLTLEKTGPASFNFWIKKSKKKISVARPLYDFDKDEFSEGPEELHSFAEPNKIIYIERETMAHLLSLYDERNDLDLKELLTIVFKDKTLATTSHSLHFLRAYHLVDMLRQTTQEDVETILLNSAEFSKSDKKKGLFYYEEPYVPKEEEAPLGFFPEEAPAEISGQAFPAGAELEMEGAEAEAGQPAAPPVVEPPAPKAPPPSKPKAPAAAPAKKEKPHRKKPKGEGEKVMRPKKSERRVIEEKIEEEESVAEALSAIKEREEETEEMRARERKEEFKPVPKEEPKFGVFGDLLKSALKKKDKEDKKPDSGESSTGAEEQ